MWCPLDRVYDTWCNTPMSITTDWASDITSTDRDTTVDIAEGYARAAIAQGMSEDRALEWAADMAMRHARSTVLRRRLADA